MQSLLNHQLLKVTKPVNFNERIIQLSQLGTLHLLSKKYFCENGLTVTAYACYRSPKLRIKHRFTAFGYYENYPYNN